jgi:diaminohydroxyphosphoribosylaminopyrimidine deaminase/5-amino-6-(5-phosphoribosylamino)uracil reductase
MIFRILEDQFAEKSKASKAADARFMQLALTLGRRGQGRTWPNPAVGAVVVKDGVIVGRGWTQPGGRPHAEPEALKRAGEAARGATLYVTLEPCSHVGKSPPCADAVIAAGIARVVSAIEDPNPEVAGQGHARLRAAGISVDIGLGALEAARDHAGHFRRIRDQRPQVILKLAVSADDKIGAAGRKPVAISGEAAKARVHLLRAQCDAILVGIGTVLADDPVLTCRLPGMEARSPVRVVLDRALRIPGTSRLVHSARETPLWVMTSQVSEAPSAMKLGAAGAQVIRVATTAAPSGLDLGAVLQALSERGITRLLVEGGARVAASFVAAGLVDEMWLLRGQGPIGADGVAALDALPLTVITGSPRFKVRASETLQNDTLTIYERT